MTDSQTVDEYIRKFPVDVQAICQKIRETIRSVAPEAVERMSYGLATFYQGENLIHFGVMKRHIGLYPGADGVAAFTDRLSGYQTSKGAIRFPLEAPIPYDLIRDIAAYRVRVAQAKHPR